MKVAAPRSFAAHLKALRETAGFTQEELATVAGLSVHAVSALERGERRRPHLETVRALSAALDLNGAGRDAFLASARAPAQDAAADELSGISLPLALTALLGREADVQALQSWLADPTARLVTLIGPGGVGKTRLALELARTIAADGAARVVLVPLATVRDPTFVAVAIAEALGLSDVSAVDLPARVRDAYGEGPLLLTIDNFEQVLDAAPVVADLLASVASVRVLVTSRAPLRLRGEREYVVGPLALDVGAEVSSPADLARSPAVRLFVERARHVRPDFRLTPANGPAVTAICRRLDALPLALELAAPWLKVLTVEDLLRRLTDDVLLSAVTPRDVPERQQTIGATVSWSYQLLEPDEQDAFRRLGALPGRFPIDAAAAVLAGAAGPAGNDDALQVVARLIDRSLLQRADTPTASRPLFQMLETVRAYAAAELAAAGEREDALEGLARYCTIEATRAEDALVGPAQVEWLDRLRDDLENYRMVLSWLVEAGRPVEAAEIATRLMFYWLIRGRAAEALLWYEEILELPLPAAVEARVLFGAAVMCYTRGAPDRVRTTLARAVELARAVGEMQIEVQSENLLGHLESAAGNANAARDRFTYSVKHFRAMEIPWGIGSALMGMAGVALATGDVDKAEHLLDEATTVLQQAGPWFLNLPLYIRAIVAVRRGNADQAIASVRASLVCSRELRDRFAFVYGLVPLAAAAVIKGDYAWAARVLGTRDAVTERVGATAPDKSVRDLRERTEHDARAHLGPDRWARSYAAGRTASIGSLLKDIDRVRR